MKQKTLFFLCLCLFAGTNAFAYDAYINGIYYNSTLAFESKGYFMHEKS